MVLSQGDIRKLVGQKKIVFSPELEEKQYGEASVDLRLGFEFTIFKPQVGIKISVADGLGSIAGVGLWDTITLEEFNTHGQRNTYCLEPGKFVLAMTYEEISVPRNLIALVEGRSTYARVGLSMHLTAPWIQPGWVGPIILEMTNNGPLAIELTLKIDKPCQLTFLELKTPLPPKLAYGSRVTDVYQHQAHPLDTKKKTALKAASAKKRAAHPKFKRGK